MNNVIYSPTGRPARLEMADQARTRGYGIGYFGTPISTAQSQYYRPRFILSGKVEDMSSLFRWEILSYSIQLFCQLGNVTSAICQKATYAIGDAWRAYYIGQDQNWGKQAEKWLNEKWYPVCDTRGATNDFVTNLWLDSIAIDVIGDSLMILMKTEEGFPQIKFVPGFYITTRNLKEIKGGPFDGFRLVNGVVLGENNRVFGYELQDNEGNYQYISTFDAQLLYEPVFHNQFRGIPKLAFAILDLLDLQDVDTYLKRILKIDSSIGLINSSESGPAFASDIFSQPVVPDNNPGTKILEYISGGEFFYINPRLGEKIEPFRSDRPHPNQSDFINRIERRAIQAIEWFPDLLDPSKIGGASTRLIQDQARAIIKKRQKTLRKRALRAIRWAVAVAIKNKILPPNDDWYMWDFDLPALLTVDSGYDRAADIDELKIGLTTEAQINAKYGRNWETTRLQRKREVEKLLQDASDLAQKYGIGIESALLLLQNANVTITKAKNENI